MKHEPTITLDGRARCSCRAWIPPTLQAGETTGHYTTRAYDDHARHVATFRGGERPQRGLFPAIQHEALSPSANSLFEIKCERQAESEVETLQY